MVAKAAVWLRAAEIRDHWLPLILFYHERIAIARPITIKLFLYPASQSLAPKLADGSQRRKYITNV